MSTTASKKHVKKKTSGWPPMIVLFSLSQRPCDTSPASCSMFCISCICAFFPFPISPLLTNSLSIYSRAGAEVVSGESAGQSTRGRAVAWHPTGSTIGLKTFPTPSERKLRCIHRTWGMAIPTPSSHSPPLSNRNCPCWINLGPTISPRLCHSVGPLSHRYLSYSPNLLIALSTNNCPLHNTGITPTILHH